MTTHLEKTQIGYLHKKLLNKGAEVNEKLVRLLSGESVDLEMLVTTRPGETPVERLRRFLDLIDSKVQATQKDGSSTYGSCERCGERLPFSELDQMPWADRCRACAGNP